MGNISRRTFLASAGKAASLSLLGAGSAGGVSRSDNRLPNFIVIFTDDQGYQDLGCFGSPLIETPNIDRMASEGARFTSFYTASAICGASRACLMTGRHYLRTGSPLLVGPPSRNGMPLKEVTIADQLKQVGYATACIGKWHLGHVNGYAPLQRGFDSYYGIPWSNDQGKQLYRDDTEIESSTDLSTITKRYTREALTFIEENRSRPFFLYLPHTMPHTPLAASKDFLGTSERGLYGDVIAEIDWSTGEILSKIRGLGLEQDTFVIFTSDNGPWLSKGEDGGSADPLRGGKWSSWEGGQREPCVMWWPGTIPAGTECREIASTLDLLPTFSELAGAALPEHPLDGRSVSSLIQSPESAITPSPNEAFLYYGRSTTGVQCIRQGTWKATSGGSLYNLEEDISESSNVAGDHPDIVKDLQELMTAMHEKVIKDEPYEDITPVIGRRGSVPRDGRISHNRGGSVDARGRSLKAHGNRRSPAGVVFERYPRNGAAARGIAMPSEAMSEARLTAPRFGPISRSTRFAATADAVRWIMR